MSYVTLDRCAGPECPRCGCQQAEILREPEPGLGTESWWGTGLARCKYCGMEFHFKPIDEARSSSPDPSRVDPPRSPPAAAMGVRTSTGRDNGINRIAEKSTRSSDPVQSIPPAGTGVPYMATACPNCRSVQTRITSSPRPSGETKIRRHECRQCGEKFKSFEKVEG